MRETNEHRTNNDNNAHDTIKEKEIIEETKKNLFIKILKITMIWKEIYLLIISMNIIWIFKKMNEKYVPMLLLIKITI